MKTERELENIARAISKTFVTMECNHADITVILAILQHESFRQICKDLDKREEGHKVKVE